VVGLHRRTLLFLAAMGPGIITMVADNDAGGISTYAQAGAKTGFNLLWAFSKVKVLAQKLLGDLFTIGRTEGLERIVGYILPENYVMQRICNKLGFEMRYDTSQDVFRAEIELRRH
jgi:hypothetical protein